MESRHRIGLYGSGKVPRSRRLWSRAPGPESLGLKDIRQLPAIRRVKHPGVKGKTFAAAAIITLAAAVAVLSALALAPTVTKIIEGQAAPGTPFAVTGITFDSTGAPVGGVAVTITDVRLGGSVSTVSDLTFTGFYIVDLSPLGQVLDNDVITISAVGATNTGFNQSNVPTPMGGYMWLNVTLNLPIPEFGDALVPAAGMIGAFLLIAMVARTRND